MCTFNVAAIFFGAIPTYGVLPYAMITCDRKVCENIAIVRESYCLLRLNAKYKVLTFASVILAISPFCIIDGCEVGRSDLPNGCK